MTPDKHPKHGHSLAQIMRDINKGPLNDLSDALISPTREVRERADHDANKRLRSLRLREAGLAEKTGKDLEDLRKARPRIAKLHIVIRLALAILAAVSAALLTPELIDEVLRREAGLASALGERDLITWTMASLAFLWVLLRTST